MAHTPQQSLSEGQQQNQSGEPRSADLRCAKCELFKHPDEFPLRLERPRGRGSRCFDCLRSARCQDCGKPVTRYATFCKPCSAKGERNPIAGTHRPESVKLAISRAQKGVPDPKRGVTKPKDFHAGRGQANRLYQKPDACELCGEVKRLDWHHIDEDATNNDRSNLAALCRRCHQITDGRHEFLRKVMPRMGRAAQL